MDFDSFIIVFGDFWGQFKQNIVEFLPKFVSIIMILLAGLIVARVLRIAARRLIQNIGRFIPSKKIQSRLQPARMLRPATVISNVLFWIVIFFFVTVATESLKLPGVTAWLTGIANYLPKILTAVLIATAGVMGGAVIRDVITSAATTAGISYAGVLGRSAQYAVLLITILIGVDQVGIDITFLTGIILVWTGAMLFGGALAFGLGAQSSVSNILASYYLQKIYQVGQTVRIDGIEGRIKQITPTAMIIDASEGQVYIPAKRFSELNSILVTKR